MAKKLMIFLTFLLLSPWAFSQDSDIGGDDAYDPFADFSEFEATADEEADIHFFKNGRFFNLGLMFGPRLFTQNLGEYNKTSLGYGLYFAYFFDIRSALQISYVRSDHDFTIPSGSYAGEAFDGFTGNTSMSTISVHMKYYFNTQNITRGFADLNPYIIGGFSFHDRSITVLTQAAIVKNSPSGVDFGVGLEIPIARNKMYFGGQVVYHLVKFSDENVMVTDFNQDPTGIFLNGDVVTATAVLGINF